MGWEVDYTSEVPSQAVGVLGPRQELPALDSCYGLVTSCQHSVPQFLTFEMEVITALPTVRVLVRAMWLMYRKCLEWGPATAALVASCLPTFQVSSWSHLTLSWPQRNGKHQF